MKNVSALSMILMMLMVTSCEIIGDIFSAGFYTGLFIVILVIAIIFFFVAKANRRR